MRKPLFAVQVFLLAGLAFLLFLGTSLAQSKKKEFSLQYLFPQQVARGRETEIQVVGQGDELASIESVQITPPDGVSVKEIKEAQAMDDEKARSKKRWSIVLAVEKEAQLGKRTLAVVTPTGQSKTKNIELVPHAPRISDLKIISAKQSGAALEFSFTLVDEAGDTGSKPRVVVNLGNDTGFMGGGVKILANVKKVEVKDPSTMVVTAQIGGDWRSTGIPGKQQRPIWVECKGGYQSNRLVAEFSF
jgi:hypothetical protein